MPSCLHCKEEVREGASTCPHCGQLTGTAGYIQAFGALIMAGVVIWYVLKLFG